MSRFISQNRCGARIIPKFLFTDKLDCHAPPEKIVMSQPNVAHPPGPQALCHFVPIQKILNSHQHSLVSEDQISVKKTADCGGVLATCRVAHLAHAGAPLQKAPGFT
jgi:hypothetical protein